MAKDIYSLGSPEVKVSGDDHMPIVSIKTKHGQKFEIIVGKDSVQVTAVTEPNITLEVNPHSRSSVLIKEKLD